ncbi:MAG TPA: hypothetical protein PLF04_09840 [Candidatus Fermentibacter daniensis]|jgi:hypothetical protein|nr:hypothetical protein [Deltaproteobacteria bacterium]HOZ18612.1 hypothetical protein [Candidatus Fermentibacter daniensis]HPH40490.1 hypothetical protein [Candidatus Fermentibacter daniensis]
MGKAAGCLLAVLFVPLVLFTPIPDEILIVPVIASFAGWLLSKSS